MSSLVQTLYELRRIDELSRGDSFLHRLHPAAKLLTTLAFLAVLASFERHQIIPLLPFAVYPIALAAWGDVPFRPIMRRLMMAEPLIIGVGLLNPLWERSAVAFGPWQISAGWLVFASIAVKGSLAVSAALALTAVTGMDGVAAALRAMKVPRLMVMEIQMTYRYLYLLVEEAMRTINAYRLRAGRAGNPKPGVWGPMVGRILIRTVDRAERIHQAMSLRERGGGRFPGRVIKFAWKDALFLCGWIALFLFLRLFDLSSWLGALVLGGLP